MSTAKKLPQSTVQRTTEVLLKVALWSAEESKRFAALPSGKITGEQAEHYTREAFSRLMDAFPGLEEAIGEKANSLRPITSQLMDVLHLCYVCWFLQDTDKAVHALRERTIQEDHLKAIALRKWNMEPVRQSKSDKSAKAKEAFIATWIHLRNDPTKRRDTKEGISLQAAAITRENFTMPYDSTAIRKWQPDAVRAWKDKSQTANR